MPDENLKRKGPSGGSSIAGEARNRVKRVKIDLARRIRVQPAHKALNERQELDVVGFVNTHQHEIHALEESMTRSKKVLATRAFQQVPRQLRRRTASHNVKKAPKRLRSRVAKEMKEDNTPTVTPRRRKPTTKQRLQRDTARAKVTAKAGNMKPTDAPAESAHEAVIDQDQLQKEESQSSSTVKRDGAPILTRKFTKRQLNKSWLPTHMYHTKRAHMTPPLEPLWRFAVPLTPTEKCYRPTHRALTLRGCMAWDMSYVGSMCVRGDRRSLIGLLRAMSVPETQLTGADGTSWRDGAQAWTGWLRERDNEQKLIAPSTVLWDPLSSETKGKEGQESGTLLFRVHPAAHLQLWMELLKLAKLQRPKLAVEDLRFEIGAIEIAGPGAAEALAAIVHLINPEKHIEQLWQHLPHLTNTNNLPNETVMSFSMTDPRLREPHRTLPTSGISSAALSDILSSFPRACVLHALLSSSARSVKLPTQKSIDRRKGNATPGTYPPPQPSDPSIPAILYTSRLVSDQNVSGAWTLLLPWRAVLPVWYVLMRYPLSTGDRPRLGGLQEVRQRYFEAGAPWYPGDFPDTEAGQEWEQFESEKRHKEWQRKPKGRRTEFDTLNLGTGAQGELGQGWTCDWNILRDAENDMNSSEADSYSAEGANTSHTDRIRPRLLPVHLTLMGRGSVSPCARIYRLPADSACRKAWLAQIPTRRPRAEAKISYVNDAEVCPPPAAGEPGYPDVPAADALVGFVTTGNFNLGKGRPTAVGSVVKSKLLASTESRGTGGGQGSADKRDDPALCIVRDAGTRIGRLARWKIIEQSWDYK